MSLSLISQIPWHPLLITAKKKLDQLQQVMFLVGLVLLFFVCVFVCMFLCVYVCVYNAYVSAYAYVYNVYVYVMYTCICIYYEVKPLRMAMLSTRTIDQQKSWYQTLQTSFSSIGQWKSKFLPNLYGL